MAMINRVAAFVFEAKYKILWGCLIVAWLWGVILNWFLQPGLHSISLRNFGLLLGAWALMRIRYRTPNNVLALAYAVAKRR